MVCLGNVCINTLRKGAEVDDDDDDDNNNNNNNNNNVRVVALEILLFVCNQISRIKYVQLFL
jgi:hypothetical protein